MSQEPIGQDQDAPQLDAEGNPIVAAPEERDSRTSGVVSWVASGAMHATALLLLGAVVMIPTEPPEESSPVQVALLPQPPPKPEVIEKKRTLEDHPVTYESERDTDSTNPETPMEPDTDVTSRETDVDSPVPKGREEASGDVELGGKTGMFCVIGPGGGSSGLMGSRTGGGTHRGVGAKGGSAGSEGAVRAALVWFQRHQSGNGMWDAQNYFQNCSEGAKCEPGSLEGHAAEEVNTAMTGYALLAFLGAGYDHKTPNTFKKVVKKGLDYLVSIQKPDGLLGARNYEHPIAAMALVEAYAMTNDIDLRGPAQKAVDVILARQNHDAKAADAAYSGLGWDYVSPGKRNDLSVTGWNVMALKSAYAAGLNVGNAMDNAKKFLERSWKDSNTNKPWCKDPTTLNAYKDISRYPYTWDSESGAIDIADWDAAASAPKGGDSHDLEPVGMVMAVFLGRGSGDPMLETLSNYVAKFQTPTAYPCNTYYLYYNTMGMYQVQGEKWKTWNGVVRDMLVGAQRRGDGCMNGSWDWQGTKFHGSNIGRVLSTAYNTLSLEVYYRYDLVNKAAHKGPKL